MSRTPETIPDKAGISNRNTMVGIGLAACFIAYVCFANASTGAGLAFGLGGIAAFWIATKIKTKKLKQGEVGLYR